MIAETTDIPSHINMPTETDDLIGDVVAQVDGEDARTQAAEDRGPGAPDDEFGGVVTLPGGCEHPEIGEIREAEVRGLTGRDEEAMAKANSVTDLREKILTCGVITLGGAQATTELLRWLSIGDRDYLLLQIRLATYGREVEFAVTCPQCSHNADIVCDLVDEVRIRETDFGMDRVVELPSGAKARLRLPSGEEEVTSAKIIDKGGTVAEANTSLIADCVYEVDGGGLWLGRESALNMGVADRRAVIEAARDNQPGPDYSGIQHTCSACGYESALVVGLGDMFR